MCVYVYYFTLNSLPLTSMALVPVLSRTYSVSLRPVSAWPRKSYSSAHRPQRVRNDLEGVSTAKGFFKG